MISVIVPVYNCEKYIGKTIESILKQSYTNYEIILIDDGSTDNSLNIIKDYEKRYNQIKVYSTQNYGVSHARNIGLEKSHGEYITFLDGDDILIEDALEIMINLILENNYDICVTSIKRLNFNGKIISKRENFEEKEYNQYNALCKFFKNDGSFETYSANAKLYKRKAINGVKFEEGRNSNEDRYFFFSTILKSNKIICKNIDTYIYRKRNNSLSTKKIDFRILDNVFFANEMHKKVENNEKLTELSEYNRIQTYLWVYRNLCRNYKINNYEVRKVKEELLNLEIKKYGTKENKIESFIIKRFGIIYKYIVCLKEKVRKNER